MTTLAPIHPGEHLAGILDALEISQGRLAKAIGVTPRRLDRIIHHQASNTADTALRIGAALGMTPDFWLNIQRVYDLDCARTATDTAATGNRLLATEH